MHDLFQSYCNAKQWMQVSGFCLVVEYHKGGSATNRLSILSSSEMKKTLQKFMTCLCFALVQTLQGLLCNRTGKPPWYKIIVMLNSCLYQPQHKISPEVWKWALSALRFVWSWNKCLLASLLTQVLFLQGLIILVSGNVVRIFKWNCLDLIWLDRFT